MGLFCRHHLKNDFSKCCLKKDIVREMGQPKISYMRFFHVPPHPEYEYKSLIYDKNIINSIIKENTLKNTTISVEEFKVLKDTIRTIYEVLKKKKEEMNILKVLDRSYAEQGFLINTQRGICLEDSSIILLCDYSKELELNKNLIFPKGGIL